MIPPTFIDELLARTDIVEIIESRVALKKTGQNFSGLCPFHQEKSPSFSVSQEKQFYYCFGCQASGSALKFLMEFDRMDFLSAVESLASRLGLAVPNDASSEDREAVEQRKLIFDTLTDAKDFYKQQLRSSPQRARAVDYLKQRGLTGEVANRFEIGFAPPGWQNLLALKPDSSSYLSRLLDAGLVVTQDAEAKRYDRFRDRVMFPIRDLRGRTIAFGGRVIGDGKPKYLNSPETAVFHKGRELYGLFEARRSQKKLSRLLVVEGYMDVVALAQNQIEFAVATLGTATSDEHIQRMFRQVSEIIFCFDGDAAGRRAAWKAMLTVLPHLSDGRSARFMFLPDGDDPDSLVRRVGQAAFLAQLAASHSVSDWLFEKLAQDLKENGLDPTGIAGKAALSKDAMPLINLMPEGVFRQLMIDALSQNTGLSTQRLQDVTVKYDSSFESAGQDARPRYDEVPAEVQDTQAPEMLINASLDPALSLLILQPELALEFQVEAFECLTRGDQDQLLRTIASDVHAGSLSSPGEILAKFSGKPEQGFLKKAFEYKPLLSTEHLKDEFIGLMKSKFKRYNQQDGRAQIDALLQKPPSQLSEDERGLIRQYFSKASAGDDPSLIP
ncbi:MAG: DNA primase [Pseudomonadales bacterium]|nr:DNA primase [Pseudomonadales bacterium]